MQSVTTSSYGDGYIALGRNISESQTHSHLLQQECMSKE